MAGGCFFWADTGGLGLCGGRGDRVSGAFSFFFVLCWRGGTIESGIITQLILKTFFCVTIRGV